MQKSDAARIIAGLTPAETKQSSAPTSVHVMSGEVVGNSESGKVQIRMDGDVVSPNDDQIIEIDALGGLEEGDTATILLTGQPGRAMTPMVMGSSGSVDRIVERIKTIEADYIKATEIEAEVATFGYLKASELETEVGKFGYLKANQLEAEVATFGYLKADDLEAEVAEFGYLKANSATITDLQADTAKIHNLSANDISAATGYIHDLTSGNVTAQNIIADHGTIVNLDSNYAHIRNGVIDNAKIGYADVNGLNANYAHIDNGVIDNATISYADVDDLDANYAHISNGVIDNATIDHADINGLDTNYAHIDNGVIDNATISYADVDDLDANYAHISNGVIDNAKIGYADVNGLNANYAQIDMANVNNAWIANGLIKDAAIKSEMVESISANQLTAGEIDADEITVRNLQASSLTVQTADGYVYVGEKRIPTKEFIDSLKDELQNEIDGAIETFTVSAVPTLNNTPANEWVVSGDAEATRKLRAKHVGDIAYVVNSSSAQNGYCYRFAYDATAQEFKWVLIKDSDVTAALSRLSTAEGKITGLETFESNTTSWIEETDEGLETIRTNHTNLSGRVDKTVVETKQLWFTKANTTAPNKPNTTTFPNGVTSTSTAGNAWRVVVPAWNASYPNYYYCLQYKLADGTYDWSDVVRDIAMGESQQQGRKGVADAATADGKAVSAQNTANANIKSSVQLWFTKADSTAPDKPNAQVSTNSASTTNAWNLAIPTYNSSYPHYFYCYQQQKGDGTYQWSDVVYDRSVTEAQAKAQAALPSSTFTTFQSTTFKNLVDMVGEQSSTITQLSDSVSSVGNILEGTVANPSNWIVSAPSGASYTKEAYGTAGVKVTFNSVGGFEWLYSQPIAVTSGNKYMVFFDYTVGKTYTTTSGKSGYGLVAYSGSNAPSGSYDDGNARFLGKAEFSKTASGDRVLKGSFTFTATSNSIVLGLNGGQIADNQTGLSFTIDNLVVGETLSTTSNTVNQVKQTATDNSARIGNLTTTLGTNADGTSKSEDIVHKYNTLDQTLNATVSRVGTTESKLDTISNPNLSPFFAMAPYRTATSYDGGYWQPTNDNWLMSGVTKLSDGWAHVTRGASTRLEVAIPRIESLSAGDKATLMIEWRNVTVTGSPNIYARNYPENCQFNLNSYKVTWTSNSETNGSKLIVMTVNSTATGDKTWNAAINLGMNNGSGVSFDGDLRISLYEGEYDGPYKPYVDQSLIERVSTAETSIEQTSNNVLIKATKSDTTAAQGGQHLIQSLINVAPDGVKIAADKVNIEGAAIFTSGRLSSTSLNNAYDAKGAASTAETNAKAYTDSVKIGGQNLLPGTEKLSGFATNSSEITIVDGVATLPGSSSAWSYFHTPNILFAAVDGNDITFSFEYKADKAVYGYIVTEGTANNDHSRSRYKDHTFNWPAQSEWTKWSVTFKGMSLTYLSQGSGGVNYFHLTMYDRTDSSNFKVRFPKLEKGTKATDWSPALEDHVGVDGRNYVRNSAGMNVSGIGGGSRYEWRHVNLHQSYMDIPHGTSVTISFDLYMTVNTANPTLVVYNTNDKGPKAFSQVANGIGSSSGVTLSFTAAAGTVIDERVSVTGYINNRSSPELSENWLEFYSTYGTSNWYSISNLKLERGTKATDWSPAPEDTVSRTQRIYYRKSSAGAPSAPSAWVTTGSNGTNYYNQWTTKVPPIASGTGASVDKYAYLYTCEQYQMADGTLDHTTILLDENTTVIDGGTIITGSLSANSINANSGTFDTALIPQLTADHIAAGSISIGKLDTSTQNKITTSENKLAHTLQGIKHVWSNDSTTRYVELCKSTINCNSSSATGAIHIHGMIGGWVNNVQGHIDLTIGCRGVPPYAIVKQKDSTVNYDFGNIVAYYDSSYVVHVYLVKPAAGTYAKCVLEMDAIDQFERVDTIGTTAPSGTKFFDLSQATTEDSRTATNYIAANSSGIKIANANPSTATTYQLQTASGTDFVVAGAVRNRVNGDGMTLYDGNGVADSNVVAKFGSTLAQIGKSGAAHVNVNDSSLLIYKDSSAYVASIGVDSSFGSSGRLTIGYGTANASSYVNGQIEITSRASDQLIQSTARNGSTLTIEATESSGAKSLIKLYSSGSTMLEIGNNGNVLKVDNLGDITIGGNLVIAGGITLGTALTAAQIPSLAASKITSGTFAAARIPNLAASKITSGTFAAARIPAATASAAGAVKLPTAIYSGTAKGSFTLTSSAANYTRLRVFFTAANGGNGSVDVYSPDDSKFSCTTTCLANDTTLQHEFAQWTISGTSVMWLNAGYVNLNVGTSIGGSVTKLTTTTNQIAIIRVEGWTW